MISKDDIFASVDTKVEEVATPEWGPKTPKVYVRVMSGLERDRWEAQTADAPGRSFEQRMSNVRAKLCALTICDEKGVRIFADGEAEKLGGKSAIVLDRIFDAAMKINRLRREDIDELVEGFPVPQPNSSNSG